jgi:hypothetical protein
MDNNANYQRVVITIIIQQLVNNAQQMIIFSLRHLPTRGFIIVMDTCHLRIMYCTKRK